MNIQSAIDILIKKGDLSGKEMRSIMQAMMVGEFTPAQIAGFLVGLHSKGETIEEIAAAAKVMRALASRVEVDKANLIDTCGTGGDGIGTFNISTTAAFVVAAAGARVAKHGNRAVSGKSGSADLLEAAGVSIELTPVQVAQCINALGIGFMFAPKHHSAMRYAVTPRRELGVRTLFNLLGPLTNPAGTKRQLLGVFSKDWLTILARVLQKLGSEQVMVVHAEDGLDEISIAAETHVAELKEDKINTYVIQPETFGIQDANPDALKVDSIEDSLRIMRTVLDNQAGPARDITVLNAGAAIYTAGVADTLTTGIEQAKSVLANGAAKAKLEALVKLTRSF